MENVFVHIGNYCLAWHRRFALLFPLSPYCISSVMSVDSNAVLYMYVGGDITSLIQVK